MDLRGFQRVQGGPGCSEPRILHPGDWVGVRWWQVQPEGEECMQPLWNLTPMSPFPSFPALLTPPGLRATHCEENGLLPMEPGPHPVPIQRISRQMQVTGHLIRGAAMGQL